MQSICLVIIKRQKKNYDCYCISKNISKGKKTNKIRVDQGGEFYNNLFKRFFKINNIEMWCDFVIIIKTINLSFCLSLEI